VPLSRRIVLAVSLGACSGQAHEADVSPRGTCPRRTLHQQVAEADVVLLGVVTWDSDCPTDWITPNENARMVLPGCIGRRADVVAIRIWKGKLGKGDGLLLQTPGPADSAGLLLRKGDTTVVFADTWGEFDPQGRSQPGWTDACMYPRGFASRGALQSALDAGLRGEAADD
jgi:hypothetical protein